MVWEEKERNERQEKEKLNKKIKELNENIVKIENEKKSIIEENEKKEK